MKKLMIAAAIVCAAAFANASSVEWSFTQINADAVAGAVDLTNYHAYLFTADTWNAVTAKVLDGKLAKDDFAGYMADANLTKSELASGVNQFTTGKQTPTGTSGTYYLILADDATGLIDYGSRAMTQFNEPTDQHDAGVWTFNPGQGASTVTYAWAGGDVPEPTSGLLLLLGMAGLALRRRRA